MKCAATGSTKRYMFPAIRETLQRASNGTSSQKNSLGSRPSPRGLNSPIPFGGEGTARGGCLVGLLRTTSRTYRLTFCVPSLVTPNPPAPISVLRPVFLLSFLCERFVLVRVRGITSLYVLQYFSVPRWVADSTTYRRPSRNPAQTSAPILVPPANTFLSRIFASIIETT